MQIVAQAKGSSVTVVTVTGSALRFEICRGLVPLREDKTPTWGASVRVLDLVYTTDFGFWGNPGAKVPSFWSKSRLGAGTSRTLELFDKNHSGLRTSPAVLNIEDP